MSDSIASGVLQAIPWIVAVFGWGFTHIFSEARERRKAVRVQLDKALESIVALEKSGRAFHAAASYEPAKAAELRLASIFWSVSSFALAAWM